MNRVRPIYSYMEPIYLDLVLSTESAACWMQMICDAIAADLLVIAPGVDERAVQDLRHQFAVLREVGLPTLRETARRNRDAITQSFAKGR